MNAKVCEERLLYSSNYEGDEASENYFHLLIAMVKPHGTACLGKASIWKLSSGT